jgi:hypothetical protein
MKIQRNIYLILFLIIGLSLISQGESNAPHSRHEGAEGIAGQIPVKVTISGDFEADGYGINGTFTNLLLNGKYIDNESKHNAIQKLKEVNYLGLTLNTCLGFKIYNPTFLGIPVKYWGLRFKNQIHTSSSYTQDLFKLLFMGNSSYKGETLDIGPSRLVNHQMYKLNINTAWAFGNESKWILETGLNFYIGNAYNKLDLGRSTLYTANDGSYLDLDLDLGYHNARSSKLYEKGFGVGTDIILNGFINNEYIIELRAYDIGTINWKKSISNMSANSQSKYEGFYIQNIFNNMIFTNDSISINDTIYSSLGIINKTAERISAFLPGFFMMKGGIRRNQLIVEGGISYYAFVAHRPEVFTNIKYQLNKNLRTDIHLIGMGYGFFNIGLGLKYRVNDQLEVAARSRKMLGFLIPNSFNGQALMLALKMIL